MFQSCEIADTFDGQLVLGWWSMQVPGLVALIQVFMQEKGGKWRTYFAPETCRL